MAAHSIAPGAEIDGFVVGEQVHAGGMATLWTVTHPGISVPILMTCALAGREGDGLVVSFGDHKNTPLLWRSFKQLLAMKFPKPAAPAAAGGSRLPAAATGGTRRWAAPAAAGG